MDNLSALDALSGTSLDLKALRETTRDELVKMDAKSIAFGMRLARDAIQYTANEGYKVTGSKHLKSFAEALDTFPIIGDE